MELTSFYKDILDLDAPWQVEKVELNKETNKVYLHLCHSPKSKFPCSHCGLLCSVYDHESRRTWRHLDTCQYETYVLASLPRVSCQYCGIKSVSPSWSRKHSRFTLLFECYAIDVLGQTQVLSRSALLLRISESQLRGIRDKAVTRGLSRRSSGDKYHLAHLCIDEKSLFRGHHYVSLLYEGSTGAVLEVVEHRTEAATLLAMKSLGEHVDLDRVQVVTMDMWTAFKTATQKSIPNADIVYDRFHIAKYLNNAVDITRRAENKKLMKVNDERLKGTKYVWLKNEENLTENQAIIREMLEQQTDLQTLKVWELKETFHHFFKSKDAEEATSFFDKWTKEVIALGNKPMIKVADMLKKHLAYLVTYPKHKVSNAMAEAVNTTVQLLKAKARGFNSAKAFRTNIFFHLGQLDLYP